MGPVDRSAGILVSILLRLCNARRDGQLTCPRGGAPQPEAENPRVRLSLLRRRSATLQRIEYATLA
jgi:hypothetical protein